MKSRAPQEPADLLLTTKLPDGIGDAMSQVKKYDPVGVCIYCGSKSNLSDEHIIPYGLGGLSVLPKSSCGACAAITSAFEGKCMSSLYGNFRLRADMPSRRKKKRPKTVDVEVPEGGSVSMPVVGTYGNVPFFHLNAPDPNAKVWWLGSPIEMKTIVPADTTVWKQFKNKAFHFYQNFSLVPGTGSIDLYARLLTRIAHALAVAELGHGNFVPWLLPFIKGERFDYDQVLAGVYGPLPFRSLLHWVSWRVEPIPRKRAMLVGVEIQLWAAYGGPAVNIVVGNTDAEMLKSSPTYQAALYEKRARQVVGCIRFPGQPPTTPQGSSGHLFSFRPKGGT